MRYDAYTFKSDNKVTDNWIEPVVPYPPLFSCDSLKVQCVRVSGIYGEVAFHNQLNTPHLILSYSAH